MLITCFQCRQQLEVPDDSAGKRVRCPHCQYVIVVPVLLKLAEPTHEDDPLAAVTALPNMELDAAVEKPAAPSINVPPNYPSPPSPAESLPPKSLPPMEELPEPPSISRGGARRRVPPRAAATSPVRWGRVVVVCALVGVIALALALVIASTAGSRPRHAQPQAVFNAPRFNPPPIIEMPKMPKQDPQMFQVFPPFNPQQVFFNWQNFLNPVHRFKVDFPGNPLQKNKDIDFSPMTVFEVRNGEWEFTVAHRALTEKEYAKIALVDRFNKLRAFFCKQMKSNAWNDNVVNLRGHAGHEWSITLPNNNGFFVRTYYVRDGDFYQHFVLTARGPNFTDRFHPDINRFFNSFDAVLTLSVGNMGVGQTVLEEIDDLGFGASVENEFTAFALHPTKPIAVVGTNSSQLKVVWTNQEKFSVLANAVQNKPIDQVCISANGRWLTAAVDGQIHLWSDWDTDFQVKKRPTMQGQRCLFTHEHHLLILSKDSIKEYEPETGKLLDTLADPDRTLQGFALSADDSLLAAYDAKEIVLWQLPQKKLLGRIEAHAAPITVVSFSPDGKTLASASVDRTIKLWDVETRIEWMTLKQHAWTVASLAFAPDGKHLASGGLDGMLLLWKLDPLEPRLVWAQANQYPVRALAWDEEGKNLYHTCKHPPQTNQGDVTRLFQRRLRKIAWADIQPNPDAAEKMTAQHAGLRIPSHGGMFFVTPDGKTLVSTPSSNEQFDPQRKARIWDTSTASVKHSFPALHGGALSPDGKYFLFRPSVWQVELHLFEMQTKRVLPARLFLNANNGSPRLLFTADSRSVWVQQNNEFVRYELPSLVRKQSLKLKGPNEQQSVMIYLGQDRQTFLVDKSPLLNSGLRKRTLYALADGKPLPLPDLAPAESSAYVRLRKSLAHFVELEDFLQGRSQVVGQQRHSMNAWALDPLGKLGATEDSSADQALKINFWDLKQRRPLLSLPDALARTSLSMRFVAHGELFAATTNSGWTRVLPTDWLLERKELLPVNVQEVGPP